MTPSLRLAPLSQTLGGQLCGLSSIPAAASTAKSGQHLYFGNNINRLMAVKAQSNPHHLLSHAQSIPAYSPEDTPE